MQEIIVGETTNIDEEPINDDIYNESVRPVAQDEENQENNSLLSVIKLPPKMRKRGHPEGLANTVIGLPKRKAKVAAVAFEKCYHNKEKK